MLSYKQFRKINESILGLGSTTLGLSQPNTVGIVGNNTEPIVEKKEEKKDKEKEGEEKEPLVVADLNPKDDKKDCKSKKPCKCEMTEEDAQFWTSIKSMMGADPNEKGWDGISPQPGECGYSPVTRIGGAFGEQVGPPAGESDPGEGGDADLGDAGGPDEGGDETTISNATLKLSGTKLTVTTEDNATFVLELTPEQVDTVKNGSVGGEGGPEGSPDLAPGGPASGGPGPAGGGPGGPPPGMGM